MVSTTSEPAGPRTVAVTSSTVHPEMSVPSTPRIKSSGWRPAVSAGVHRRSRVVDDAGVRNDVAILPADRVLGSDEGTYPLDLARLLLLEQVHRLGVEIHRVGVETESRHAMDHRFGGFGAGLGLRSAASHVSRKGVAGATPDQPDPELAPPELPSRGRCPGQLGTFDISST